MAVKNGQRVTAGQLIAQVDTRDARLALESAELAYQKLVKPADVVSITQAKNNVAQAYSDALRTLSTSFIDFQTIVTGLDTLLNNYQTGALNDNAVRNYGDAAMSLRTEAINTFYVAQRSYTTALQHYSSLTRTSDNTQIEAALAETYDTSRQIAEAVKRLRTCSILFVHSKVRQILMRQPTSPALILISPIGLPPAPPMWVIY